MTFQKKGKKIKLLVLPSAFAFSISFVVSGSVRSNDQGKDMQDPPLFEILNPIVMRTGTLESMLLLHRIDGTVLPSCFFYFKYPANSCGK